MGNSQKKEEVKEIPISNLNIYLLEENDGGDSIKKYFINDNEEKISHNVLNSMGEKQIIQINLAYIFNGEIIEDVLSEVFYKLRDKKNVFSESIILSLSSNYKEKLVLLLKNLNELEKDEIQPFIIIVANNSEKIEDYLSSKEITMKYEKVDFRIFSIINKALIWEERSITPEPNDNNSTEENPKEKAKKNIRSIFLHNFLKFCSYYNELGDIHLENEEKKNDELFLSSYNILCVGRSQVGKSTLINTLLNEKKAREGMMGVAVTTSKRNKYKINNYPINIFDIPGFSKDKDVNDILSRIQEIKMNLSLHKEELHLIIYVLIYDQSPIFNENEIPFLEELSKDNTKLLFVLTHSRVNPYEPEPSDNAIKNRIEQIKRINLSFKKNFFVSLNKNEENEEEQSKKNKKILLSFYNKTRKKLEEKEIIGDYKEIVDNIIHENSICFINFVKDTTGSIDVPRFGIDILIHKINEKLREKLEIILSKTNKNKLLINSNLPLSKENIEVLDSEIIPEENVDLLTNRKETSINNESSQNTNNNDKKEKNYEIVNLMSDTIENKYNYYKEKLESIKNEAERRKKIAEEEIGKYIGGAAAIGAIPVVDLIVQSFIKDKGFNKIAEIFGFQENVEELDEKKFQEKVKENTTDYASDSLKTAGRTATIGSNIFNYSSTVLLSGFSTFARAAGGIALGVAGIVIGTVTGGVIMKSDLKKVIDIYYEKYLFDNSFHLTIEKDIEYFQSLENKYKNE